MNGLYKPFTTEKGTGIRNRTNPVTTFLWKRLACVMELWPVITWYTLGRAMTAISLLAGDFKILKM